MTTILSLFSDSVVWYGHENDERNLYLLFFKEIIISDYVSDYIFNMLRLTLKT